MANFAVIIVSNLPNDCNLFISTDKQGKRPACIEGGVNRCGRVIANGKTLRLDVVSNSIRELINSTTDEVQRSVVRDGSDDAIRSMIRALDEVRPARQELLTREMNAAAQSGYGLFRELLTVATDVNRKMGKSLSGLAQVQATGNMLVDGQRQACAELERIRGDVREGFEMSLDYNRQVVEYEVRTARAEQAAGQEELQKTANTLVAAQETLIMEVMGLKEALSTRGARDSAGVGTLEGDEDDVQTIDVPPVPVAAACPSVGEDDKGCDVSTGVVGGDVGKRRSSGETQDWGTRCESVLSPIIPDCVAPTHVPWSEVVQQGLCANGGAGVVHMVVAFL